MAGGYGVRTETDYKIRYPELQILQDLPEGTLLDGELVMLGQGPPGLPGILRRHGLTKPTGIQQRSQLCPVTYIVFDLLYFKHRSLCGRPLLECRQTLSVVLAEHAHPRLAFSQAIAGSGKDLFVAAVAQGHEGIMAKHRDSRYLPGQRSAAWRKIKPRR